MPWDHCSVIYELFVFGLSLHSIISTVISPTTSQKLSVLKSAKLSRHYFKNAKTLCCLQERVHMPGLAKQKNPSLALIKSNYRYDNLSMLDMLVDNEYV